MAKRDRYIIMSMATGKPRFYGFGSWSDEYPDAERFDSILEACRKMEGMSLRPGSDARAILESSYDNEIADRNIEFAILSSIKTRPMKMKELRLITFGSKPAIDRLLKKGEVEHSEPAGNIGYGYFKITEKGLERLSK